MTGTTFTLPKQIVEKVEKLRRSRGDATKATTVRFLVLKGLDEWQKDFERLRRDFKGKQ